MSKEYQRTDRIADIIQRELSVLLQQDVRDPDLKFITITAVKVAPDLSFAKIFITQLNRDNKLLIQPTLKKLNKLKKFLRFRLANTVDLRITPQLHFVYDASISQANHLSSLIDAALAEDERKRKE